MSTNKFLSLVNGVVKTFTAIAASAGAADASKIVMTDASGKLDTTLMPNGIGADTTTRNAAEALAAGDFVWINASGLAAKADNTAEKPADGFVLAAVANGAPATIFRSGTNSARTGMTAGTRYWLGTAGGVTTTPPTAANSIVQQLGVATSATEINFDARGYVLNG